MREMTKLVEAGKVMPKLDPHCFTFADTDEAHRLIEDRQADGKLVVEID
jgi:NADPH2:quinone reductase